MLCAAAACGPRELPEFRIGVLASLSGTRSETSGRQTVEGAELAARVVNDSGGLTVGGRRYRVMVVIRDVGDQADKATAAARELINTERVAALVGPQFSRDALPVANLAEAAQVPMISPMSSNREVTRDKRFVFRVAFTDDVQGAAAARFALEQLKARRAAVLYDVAGEYSRGLAQEFVAHFERGGGRMVAREEFTTDAATDFRPQLRRIRAARPDVLFLPNFMPPLRSQLSQAREVGVAAVFLGSDSWDAGILATPESDGSFVVNQWHSGMASDSSSRRVLAAFRALYGHDARTTAAATWDAFHLLFHAARSAGSVDPSALRDGLAAIAGYQGVTGAISFAGGNDPAKSAAIVRVERGASRFERRLDP